MGTPTDAESARLRLRVAKRSAYPPTLRPMRRSELPARRSSRLPSRRLVLSALLPLALILHELGFFLARAACDRGGELATSAAVGVAVIVAMGWSLALAPLLSRVPDARRGLLSSLLIAMALFSIFLSQEVAESLILGDGLIAAQAAFAVLVPICFALGALGARLTRAICHAAVSLISGANRKRDDLVLPAMPAGPRFERGAAFTSAPLAFRLASRPPPALA